MSIAVTDIVPFSEAWTQLSALASEAQTGKEKNGEGAAALIGGVPPGCPRSLEANQTSSGKFGIRLNRSVGFADHFLANLQDINSKLYRPTPCIRWQSNTTNSAMTWLACS
ncbi:hypothetical protein [Methylomonas sp. UP202]|uniref:hypothetical protein n=1 Tax=Methylomonas sp. UP202 TaxID=3040943 RepID=UPI002479177B|nr:hypothetical protein [Methylomonas sp. UP202]WGS86937.1 hypothetical protein QC632_04085 [Methylomonas sp. UP202]